MIRVYTKDGQPLDAEREIAIFRSLLSSEEPLSKGVLYGMTVKAGSAFNVSKVPGRVFIAGTVIDDDAAETDWMNLDAIEPPGAFDRSFYFYAKFNPATDSTMTYGVVHLPSDPVSDVIDLLNEPSKVVIGVITVPQAATSAQDGIYSRPSLLWNPERIRRAAIDAPVLSFEAATYETTSAGVEGAGTKTIKWAGMKVSGENLGWQVTVTGSSISEAGPNSTTYTNALVIPNWGRGLLFVRVSPNLDTTAGVTQNQALRFVGFSSLAQMEDTLEHWFSNDYDFDLTETWPQRIQREDIKILAHVQDGQIFWINGSITNVGHHSVPSLGDSHNTLSIASTSYATSSTPDKDGQIDLDDIITNLPALNELDLDAAYDKVGVGGGAGRTITSDSGPVEVNLDISSDETPEDAFFVGVRVNLNADTNAVGGYSETGFEAYNNDSSAPRVGVRSRSLFINPSSLGLVSRPVTLTRVSDDVHLAFDTPTDFPLALFDDDPDGRMFIVRFGSGLPGGTDAGAKFYRLKRSGSNIVLLSHDRFQNIVAVRPNDFGSMASDISTFATVYQINFEAGDSGAQAKELLILGDAKVEGETTLAGLLTAQEGIVVSSAGLDVAGGIVASTGDIEVTEGDIFTNLGNLQTNEGDIVALDGDVKVFDANSFKATFYDSYRFHAPVERSESLDFKMENGSSAWRQGIGHIFSPTTLDQVRLFARIPSGGTLKSLIICSQISDPSGELSISVHMMRALKTASGASPYTLSSALNATTTPPVVNASKGSGLYYRETIGLGDTAGYSDPMWLVVVFDGAHAQVGNIMELVYETSYIQR